MEKALKKVPIIEPLKKIYAFSEVFAFQTSIRLKFNRQRI